MAAYKVHKEYSLRRRLDSALSSSAVKSGYQNSWIISALLRFPLPDVGSLKCPKLRRDSPQVVSFAIRDRLF